MNIAFQVVITAMVIGVALFLTSNFIESVDNSHRPKVPDGFYAVMGGLMVICIIVVLVGTIVGVWI